MDIEKMTEQELTTIKGGKWIFIVDEWVWVDTLSLDPEEEDI